MNARDREMRLKLDILHSLARSQRAITTMLEQVAITAEDAESARRFFRANLAAIGRCQRALAECIGGVRFRKVMRSAPGKVWLNERCKVTIVPAVRRSNSPLQQYAGLDQSAAESV